MQFDESVNEKERRERERDIENDIEELGVKNCKETEEIDTKKKNGKGIKENEKHSTQHMI